MKRLLVILFSFILLAACQPSPEEIATLTASAWTPTPPPTSTPLPTLTSTPVPYDLTVQVTDIEGNLIVGADITISELGDDALALQSTNNVGQVSWTNLPGDSVSLKAYAQGYLVQEISISIIPGENYFVLKLERDPFGLLVADWASEGQTVLFIEDFQDGEEDFLEMTGDWQVIDDAENPGNKVIQINQLGSEEFAYVLFGPDEYLDNFILEYKFRWIEIVPSGDVTWLSMGFDFWDKYAIVLNPENGGIFQLLDYGPDEWKFPIQINRSYKIGTWYTIRVEVNQPEIRLYIDGKLLKTYKNLEAGDPDSDQAYLLYALPKLIGQFDDIVFITP